MNCCGGWRRRKNATRVPAAPMPSAAPPFVHPQASLPELVVVILDGLPQSQLLVPRQRRDCRCPLRQCPARPGGSSPRPVQTRGNSALLQQLPPETPCPETPPDCSICPASRLTATSRCPTGPGRAVVPRPGHRQRQECNQGCFRPFPAGP